MYMQATPCGTFTVTDRSTIELTGIRAVESFDEASIVLSVSSGGLTVEGEQLHIEVLNLEKGIVSAVGKIHAVFYTDSVSRPRGLFSRLLGKNA